MMSRNELIDWVESSIKDNQPFKIDLKQNKERLLYYLRNEDKKFLNNPNWHTTYCIKNNKGSCICK